MSRRAEKDLSCKGNISRSRKAGRSWLGQRAWLSFSPTLQNLCDFWLVHLAPLISQINRHSSQLPDTFNHRVLTKAGRTKSAADRLETSPLSASLSEDTSSYDSAEGPRLVRGAHKSRYEPILTTATHTWPLWWWWVFFFSFSSPQAEIL